MTTTKRLLVAFAVLGALVAAPGAARAVDNSKHVMGVGALTEFSGGSGAHDAALAPAQLSLKLPVSSRAEASFLFGMRLASESSFFPGLKFSYVMVPEAHVNLYVAVAMALDLETTGGLQAFLYQLGPGLELFFSDFPNVGISFEFGLGGSILSGSSTFQGLATTATGTFGGAGVHYYF